MVIFNTLNLKQISQYLSQFLRYKNFIPHFGNLKSRCVGGYPILRRQCFIYKILATVYQFCLVQGPRFNKALFWFEPWNSLQIFIRANYFHRMNDSQNEHLLEWNLKYTMQRFKNFPKECKVHLDITAMKTHKITCTLAQNSIDR